MVSISAISNVNYPKVSFGNNPEKKTGGAGKAWASGIFPGLGQFLDGRNKAGSIFASSRYALLLLGSFLGYSIHEGELTKTKCIGFVATVLAGTALFFVDIVDAYKGDKNRKEQAPEQTKTETKLNLLK